MSVRNGNIILKNNTQLLVARVDETLGEKRLEFYLR